MTPVIHKKYAVHKIKTALYKKIFFAIISNLYLLEFFIDKHQYIINKQIY